MALELIKPHYGFFGYLLLLFPVKVYCLSIGFHGHAEIPPEGERRKLETGLSMGMGIWPGWDWMSRQEFWMLTVAWLDSFSTPVLLLTVTMTSSLANPLTFDLAST